MESWSIAIMCYNEEDAIYNVVVNSYSLLSKLSIDFELIVVNDGSTDASLSILKELQSKTFSDLKIISHPINRGIGATLRTAYSAMKNENVMVICGDGQFDLNELTPYINFPKKSILSFYRKENEHYGFGRTILSTINKLINKFVLGTKLKDINWVKAYKKEELDKISINIKSSLVESEICSKLLINNNNLIEIKSKYLPRIGGKSKGASLKIVLQAFSDLILLILEITMFRIRKNIQNK